MSSQDLPDHEAESQQLPTESSTTNKPEKKAISAESPSTEDSTTITTSCTECQGWRTLALELSQELIIALEELNTVHTTLKEMFPQEYLEAQENYDPKTNS